jgi:hypothetical protein
MSTPATSTPPASRRARTAATATARVFEPGIVVFGDVVGSRRYAGGAADWLARLCADFDQRYGDDRLAPFDFTQGDELQGLLVPGADPFEAVLVASLTEGAPRMRWVAVAGMVEAGEGPATRRTGPAFLTARASIELARQRRDGLLATTGDEHADGLLEDTAPVLADLLDRLTPRQQTVTRLILVDGHTQAEVAELLDVARATISVSAQRAGVRSVGRLLGAVRQLFREGAQLALAAGTVAT